MLSLEIRRADTPACLNKIHFNNAGAALMPTPVVEAIQQHLLLEAASGGYEAADLREKEILGFYQSTADLIGAEASEIAFTSSATNSYSRALSCIPFQTGDTILIANEDYISNQIAFLSLQKRFGVQLVRAASLPEGGVDVEDMARLMDLHHPRLVSLSHIPTNTGLIQPVEEVGKLCAARSITYLVDACQSVGQIPVDVKKIQCDFLTVTFRKFLRGPRGTGFLYVSNNILSQNWEPLFIDMRGASWTGHDAYTIRPDARRFEDWELPYPLVLGSKAAADYALRIGMSNIRDYNNTLCESIRKGISKIDGLRLLDLGKNVSSIITISVPRWQPKALLEELRRRNINTSIGYKDFALIDFEKKGVNWALRVSPHYYNTREEVDVLMGNLGELVK